MSGKKKIQAESTSKIFQKEWTDELLNLHSKMINIIKKDCKDINRFICIVCEEQRSPYRSAFIKNMRNHFENKTHQKNMEIAGLLQVNTQILKALKKNSNDQFEDEETKEEFNSHEKEKKLKIEVSKFIVTNHLPYKITENLVDFIKDLISKYETEMLLSFSITRNTTSKIAQVCLGDLLKEDIFEELMTSPFSLSLDESSDSFGKAYLTVCAKFLEQNNLKTPKIKLIRIIQMNEEKTGKELYKIIKEEILTKDPKIEKNFMGVVTDGARSMIGQNIGLVKRLTKDYPHIISFRDISHIYNLICKHSVKTFPSHIIQIIKDICSHFGYSCSRRVKLRKIQAGQKQTQILDIIRYTDVRWLSLTQSLNRILCLWESLGVYYKKYGDADEIDYFSPENEMYLRILFNLMELLSYYNLENQREDLLYDDIVLKMKESFVIFAKMVVHKDKSLLPFDELYEFSFDGNDNQLKEFALSVKDFSDHWIEVYPDIKKVQEKVDKNLQKEIFENTRKFILKILSEMKNRLPFSDKILEESQVIFLREWNSKNWKVLVEKFVNIVSVGEQRNFHNELNRFEINFARHSENHHKSGKSIRNLVNIVFDLSSNGKAGKSHFSVANNDSTC